MNAKQLYLERRKQIDKEIEILKQKLERMDIEQKKDQQNYGYAGNCGHIIEQINELNYQFMMRY